MQGNKVQDETELARVFAELLKECGTKGSRPGGRGKGGGFSGPGGLIPFSPIETALSPAWQHDSSHTRGPAPGKEGPNRKGFTQPGVGLGREGPELSSTVGLI